MDETRNLRCSSSELDTLSERQNYAKRTSSDAGIDFSDFKSSRKRGAKACQSCRSRKVRCSVSDHGIPCYNCKLDEVECVIPERKKPNRSVKRQKTIETNAVVSGATLESSNIQIGKHSFADRELNHRIGSPPISITSTSQQSEKASYAIPISDQYDLNARPPPPCDEDVAHWLKIMPPQVVDKMFEYLTALKRSGRTGQWRLDSRCINPQSCITTTATTTNTSSSAVDNARFKPIHITKPHHLPQARASASSPRHAEPLSPQSQPEDFSITVSSRKQYYERPLENESILQYLRDSFGASKQTMKVSEPSLQTADYQTFNKVRSMPSINSSLSKQPLLADPRRYESPSSFIDSIAKERVYPVDGAAVRVGNRILHDLGQLFSSPETASSPSLTSSIGSPASTHESRFDSPEPQDDTSSKADIEDLLSLQLDNFTDIYGNEGEFQEAFDSLIDFGDGADTLQAC
ncbi:hypothetical protein FQN57_006598 [Myotisia sp. PD_48]|nr:hypothetical protein FQN57_006598 [Myotisia sp. PD_48]